MSSPVSLAAYSLSTAPVLVAVSLASPPFLNVAGDPQTGRVASFAVNTSSVTVPFASYQLELMAKLIPRRKGNVGPSREPNYPHGMFN